MPIIFKNMPARTICGMLITPVEKTIALGGVATGSIKAQLAAIAIAAVNNNGSKPNCVAMMATIGRNVAVVAKFEVSSVKNIIKVVNIQTSKIKLKPTGIKLPIQAASPVLCAAAAKDNPPPNNKSTPHGTPFSASFQSKRLF